MIRDASLSSGSEFPSFPSLELSHLITPIIFSQKSYLVYILQVPLLQTTIYQLYKVQPFPMKQHGNVFVYLESKKDFIFVDTMRHKYGKMNYQELHTYLTPN
jgi:hypothetical protein